MDCKGAVARFIRYCTVGLLLNVTGYLLFLFLLAVFSPTAASGVTYVVVVAASYVVNRKWSFRSQSSHSHDMVRYLAAYGVGLAVALVTMQLLSGFLHPALAQVLVIVLAALSIYASLELMRFGRQEPHHDH